uniref:Uncharacterized protein n=1 Tax=Tetraselmis sp. GSL018 TaxID=582737 RepID=A0A061RLA8_9CHLO
MGCGSSHVLLERTLVIYTPSLETSSMTSKSNESTLEDGSDDRRHRLNPQSTEGANGSIGPPGEGSSRGAEEAAHPLPLQLSGAPGAGPGSRQDAAFLPLSPIQQEPDSASPPLSVEGNMRDLQGRHPPGASGGPSLTARS